MDNKEIENKIFQDMANLQMHEANTSWMRYSKIRGYNTSSKGCMKVL